MLRGLERPVLLDFVLVGYSDQISEAERVELREFRRSFDEALRWCRPRFSMYDTQASLRSDELRPDGDLFDSVRAQEVVSDVILRRRLLLEKGTAPPNPSKCSFWGYQSPAEPRAQHRLAVFQSIPFHARQPSWIVSASNPSATSASFSRSRSCGSSGSFI